MPDHLYQQKLHDQFLQQLVDDWEVHFARHGESGANLPGVQNENGFVEALADVVERELAAQVGRKEAIRLTSSKDTFRWLLFEYDTNNRWQTKTKQALCLFWGLPVGKPSK